MGWKIKALGERHNSFKVLEYKMPEQLENSLNARKDSVSMGWCQILLWNPSQKEEGVGGKLKVH